MTMNYKQKTTKKLLYKKDEQIRKQKVCKCSMEE